MPASLQKFSDDRKIDPNHERPIQCPYCPQQYLLIWDDAEWNSVKDWIRLAEAAVRRSHRLHGDIELAPTLKVFAEIVSRTVTVFFDDASWILVLAKADELGMSQPISVHPFEKLNLSDCLWLEPHRLLPSSPR